MGRKITINRKNLLLNVKCIAVALLIAAPVTTYLISYSQKRQIENIQKVIDRTPELRNINPFNDFYLGTVIQYCTLSLAIILILLFIYWRIKKSWLPFHDTLDKLKKFDLEQQNKPVFIDTDIEEFSQLNNALSALMDKDISSYLSQKEFIENASHEMLTPLAIIKGKINELLQKNLPDDQAGILNDMYEEISHLSHLDKGLLLLAKIDNRQYSSTIEIELNNFIKRFIPSYECLATTAVEFNSSVENFTITANTTLLESLLNNLVVNAIRYSSENSPIQIILNENKLIVTNISDSDEPLDSTKIFNRFVRNNFHKEGNGLGLAIVKSTCDYYDWNIHYDYASHKHTFTINFNQSATS
jgi:two-component system OmpR family sensor kinase